MSSLTEYIRWYADFTFYDMPFNEVDNLILSTLAYYQYDLKRSEGRPVALRRCVTNSTVSNSFLRAACNSVRFGSLMVSEYAEVFSKDTSAQFAAMQFHLYDNVYYISFRGTDFSLVGWKEDFMMSYRKIASQESAVKYLEDVMRDDRSYILGGHSKGGNLALYGACHISGEQRGLIRHIYNNDGPGLCPDVCDAGLIDLIKDRITVIVPQYCVFGKIFAHDIADVRIVTSSYKGINQHDIISWGVSYGKLDVVTRYDAESLWMNDIADKWLQDVAPAEREALVKSVFEVPESRGVKDYTDAMKMDVDGVEDLVKNVVESNSLRAVAKIPAKVLFGDMIERLRSGKLAPFINANQLTEGVVFLVVGLLMAVFSQWAFHVVVIVLMGGFVLFQLIYTLKKIKESHWNFIRERTRVYLFLVIAALFAIVLVKEQAVFIVGSGIAGGWLLVTAYKSFLAVKGHQPRDFAYWKTLVKAVLYAGCGVFIMVAPLDMLTWFVLILGAVMAIDGICTIVYSVIQANDKYAEKYYHLKEKVQKKKQ